MVGRSRRTRLAVLSIPVLLMVQGVTSFLLVDQVQSAPDALETYPSLDDAFDPPGPSACADFAGTGVIYPSPADGCDPYDYGSYLRIGALRPGEGPQDFTDFPSDYAGCGEWKYTSCRSGMPHLDNDPAQLFGVTGMSVDQAWRYTTGRPDVIIAVTDSGIYWEDPEVRNKAYLNLGELPTPTGGPKGSPYADYDTNGDGIVSVDDYTGVVDPTAGPNPRGQLVLDPQDLIFTYSDGIDDDGNGWADDISGWNFLDDDNDAWDEVRYGHGNGEAKDSTAQANNGGTPGTCPNCVFMPMRQGQSFLAHSENYAESVVFATDTGAHVVQSALGSVDANAFTYAAHEYAWRNGVIIVASAADEAAGHHNMPTNVPHAMNFNSVRTPGIAPAESGGYLFLNGCTNFMATITVSVPSTSCSSEAVGRGAGVVGLLVSQAKNMVATGELEQHPDLPDGRPLSFNEAKQLITRSADDIDFSGRTMLAWEPAPSKRYDSIPGYDQYFGYGRLNAANAVAALANGDVPPEAELTAPRWWQLFDPVNDQSVVSVEGLTGAVRTDGTYTWSLDYGCGAQPLDEAFVPIASGSGDERAIGPLAEWDLVGSGAVACAALAIGDPTTHHAVTLRLRVTDANGLVGEDRIPLFVHIDPTRNPLTQDILSSGESSTMMADMDGDTVLDLVVPSSGGEIQAYRGDGSAIWDPPLRTDPEQQARNHPEAPFWQDHVFYESISPGGIAIGDLDHDGRPEVVTNTLDGKVYAWHHDGTRVDGFPVGIDRSLSTRYFECTPGDTRLFRDDDFAVMPGTISQPVLGDLDLDGDLEIIQSSTDGHVYGWHHDGSEAFPPERVLDWDLVIYQNECGKVKPTGTTSGVKMFRGGKIVSTPTLAQLDGDDYPELVLGTNDHYGEDPNWDVRDPAMEAIGEVNGLADLLDMANARLFALDFRPSGHHSNHPNDPTPCTVGSPCLQPFWKGDWPVPIGDMAAEILPYVGEGIPGSAAAANLDAGTNGDVGYDEVIIFSTAGPAYVIDSNGRAHYDGFGGDFLTLPTGVAGPGSNVYDTPFFPAVGTGSIGDLEGDGSLDYVAPVAGLGRLLDVALPAEQIISQDGVMAWDLQTQYDGDGALDPAEPLILYQNQQQRPPTVKPAWPRANEDLMFITNPVIADVDGDGTAEVLAGSATSYLHAFRVDGTEPPGWPKFTGNWIIDSPSTGDIDGDGLMEVAATTREGFLWVWDTPAPADARQEWWSQHHDEWNTGNHGYDTRPPAAIPYLGIAPRTDDTAGLTWTTPGDDGMVGQAAGHVVQLWTLPVSPAPDAALLLPAAGPGEPVFEIIDFDCSKPYVQIYAFDEAGNKGWPSDIIRADAADCPLNALEDPDGDGTLESDDVCPGTYDPAQTDSNGDGVGDACDGDGDSVHDDADNCPAIPNPGQDPEACAPTGDHDEDGVTNGADNCPATANPNQSDLDRDGQGDACDDDIDGDGVSNGEDRYPFDRRRW